MIVGQGSGGVTGRVFQYAKHRWLTDFRSPAALIFIFLLFPSLHAKIKKDALEKARRVIEGAFESSSPAVREKAAQALSDVSFPNDKLLLQKALKDRDDYVRIAAALALSKKGDLAGAPVLQEILETRSSSSGSNPLLAQLQSMAEAKKRSAAAKALGVVGGPAAKPVLQRARQDKDPRVRDAAAVGLARLGDKTELVVFQSAVEDADDGVRQAAMEALADIAHPDSLPHFLNALSDPAGTVRIPALLGLRRLNSRDTWRDVAALLRDNNALVRQTAVENLGFFRQRDAAPVLQSLLEDANGFVRIGAAQSLLQAGDRSGVPVLQAFLTDNDADVRARAVEAVSVSTEEKDREAAVPLLDDENEQVSLAAALALWKRERGGVK